METKDELRNLQNKYLKKLDNLEASKASCSVPKEHFVAVRSLMIAMEHHFVQIADQDLHKKQQDILTVK